jgi:hypothetical protein
MSTTDPKNKTERSKYLTPAYTVSNVLRQEEYISSATEPLLNWLDSYASEKKPMNLSRFFSFTTFDVVGEVVFSRRFGFLELSMDIGNAVENSLALIFMREACHTCYYGQTFADIWTYSAVAGFFLWLHWALLANPVVTWLGTLPMGHLFSTTQKAISERVLNQDARGDVILYWFKQHRQNPKGITMRDIHTAALVAVGLAQTQLPAGCSHLSTT